ncbi:pyridoxal-phosphate dependent enzyme [Cupriavidus necator]
MNQENGNLDYDFSRLAADYRRDAIHVRQFALHTPLIRLPWLSTLTRKVWAKLECNQLTNSFKIRGAFNAMRKLSPGQAIYTASAGNHGLAIAYVARALGRVCVIYVPVNASELKLRRLIQGGASVETAGRDLHEATLIAKGRAASTGSAFISPYAHEDVIRGQGSLAVEILEDMTEPIDTVIAPLGGGGLIAGLAPVFKAQRASTRLIGVHPGIFQRNLSGRHGNGLSKVVPPTLADGLAVQHEEADAELASRVLASLDEIRMASEREIEQAVVALLHNESVLAEGAGAISLVPLLHDLDAAQFRGNTVVIISGGNIAGATVMKCFTARSDNARVATMLGHQSARLASEVVKKDNVQVPVRPAALLERRPPVTSMWSRLLVCLRQQFIALQRDLHLHVEYVSHQGLDRNANVTQLVVDSVDRTLEQLCDLAQQPHSEAELRAHYRLLIQQYAFLRNSLAWCSASTDQSRIVMFFDSQENSSSTVNYDRYGSMLLRRKEILLLQSLGFDPERNDLLLVSSGQAAFSVIESFLMGEALCPNTKAVTAPYIYFEALEQLQRLPHVDIVRAKAWDIDTVIELVERERARVVFIDPLANLGTMNVVDLRVLAERLAGKDWSDKWLVIDGTMVSGGLDVFSIFDQPGHPNVLYYESGSKYLQLGLDLQMAGVIVCRKSVADRLAVARRNTGAVMYQSAVCRFPDYNRGIYLERMALLTRNAEILLRHLERDERLHERIEAAYPRRWRDLGWAHGGGVVAIHLCEDGLNNYACLDALIERLMERCRAEHVAMTKGVSFGFATTRVSAAAAMADNMPPFLRFSVGEESETEMNQLGRIVAQTLDEFLVTRQSLLA